MSTDAVPWRAQADVSSIWRRAYWTAPLALLICAVVFLWFAYSMEHAARRPTEPAPVDAELVELAASPQPLSVAKPPPEPAARQEVQQPAAPAEQVATERAATQAASAVAAPAPSAPAPAAPPIQNQRAQAVTRPLPVIPDELREEAMSEAATVRFHVAADGTTTVELIRPTQNPRLNRLLLGALKQWKFSPAIKDGKPVPSVEDIVVRVNVE